MVDRKTGVELLLKARDQTGPATKSAEGNLRRLAEQAQKRSALEKRLSNVNDLRQMRDRYREVSEEAGVLARQLKSAGLSASKEQVTGFRAAREEVRRLKVEMVDLGATILRQRGQVAQAGAGSFAAVDALARPAAVSTSSAAVTDREGQSALRAAQSLRNLRDAREQAAAAARELRAAEDALEAEQLSGTATAERLVEAQRRVAAAYNAAETASRRVTAAEQATQRAQAVAAGRKPGGGSFADRVEGAYTSRQGRGPLGLRPYELQNLGYQVNDFFTQIASGTPITQAFTQQVGQVAQIFPGLISSLVRFSGVIGFAAIPLALFVTEMKRLGDEAKTLKDMDILLTRIGDGAEYQVEKLATTAQSLDRYSGSLNDAKAAIGEFVSDNVAPEYIESFGRAALDYAKVMKVDVADAAKLVSDAFTGNADAVLALDDQINFLTDAERKQIEEMKKSGNEAGVRTKAFDIFARRYGETAEKMRGQWTTILNNFTSAWSSFSSWVNGIDLSGAVREIQRLLGWVNQLIAKLPGARTASEANLDAWEDRLQDEEERVIRGSRNLTRDYATGFGPYRRIHSIEESRRTLERIERDRAEIATKRKEFADLANPTLPSDTTTEPDPPAKPKKQGKTDAERLAEAQAKFLKGLTAENEQRRFQIGLIGEAERSQIIQEGLRRKSLEAEELGLKLTAAQKMEYASLLALEYDRNKALRDREALAQAELELARARGEVMTRAAYIELGLKQANIDAESEIGKQIADNLGKTWDIEEANRKRAAADREVNRLLGMQGELQRQIAEAQDLGDFETAGRLELALNGVNAELSIAIENARQMWLAIGGPEAEEALLALDGLEAQLRSLNATVVTTKAEIDQMIEDSALGGWDRFWQDVEEGRNVLLSLRDAFLQFAADFLRQIARMIVQQMAFNALQGAAGAGSGGVGGGISGLINGLFGGGSGNISSAMGSFGALNAAVRHTGGMAGDAGASRMVPATAFAAAMRFHKGGIPGLGPNEVPIIAEADEEVITRGDPRHRFNRGGGSQPAPTVVNVFDPADFLSRALSTDRGQRIILNFVRENSDAFKAAGA